MPKNTTITTVKKQIKPNSRPRRKGAKITTTKVVRTRNNRRSRQPPREVISRTDREIAHSTQELLQTLFSGISGIHRGLSLGSGNTAICRIKQIFTVNVPAGSYASYAWAPAAAQSSNAFQYAYSAGGAGILASAPTDPFNSLSTVGISTLAKPGAFYPLDPSTEWRVVRASMQIDNTSPIIDEGGPQCHVRVDNLYNGGSLIAGGLAQMPSELTSANAWSQNAFANFEYMQLFRAQKSVVLQWYPNDDEIYIEPRAAIVASTFPISGFAGYFYAPPTKAQVYNFTIDYGVEYVPNKDYKQFVDRKQPLGNPGAQYELNKFIGRTWDQVVITTKERLNAWTSKIEHLPGLYVDAYEQEMGVYNPISDSVPFKREASYMEDICEGVEYITGGDVCGAVKNTAKHIGKTLVREAFGGQRVGGHRMIDGYIVN